MKFVALLAAILLAFAQVNSADAAAPVASGSRALQDLQAETGIVLDPSTLPNLLMEAQKYDLGQHNWQVRWYVQEAYYRIGLMQRGPLVTDSEIETYIAKRLMGNPRNPDPVCVSAGAPMLPSPIKRPLLERCTTVINVNRTYFFSLLHFSVSENQRYTLFVMDSSPNPYDGVHAILLNILSRISLVSPTS